MLANAVGHSPDTSTDTPPSGASRTVAPPLPQFNPVQFPGSGRLSGRRAVDLDLDFDLRRPVKPRWPNAGITERVNRQDAGLAAMGQGRAIAAARGVMPAFGHTEPRRGAEWWGKSPFGYFWGSFPKVTRRKGGTHFSRYPNNGYVPSAPHDNRRCVDTYAAMTAAQTTVMLTDLPLSQASQLPH